MFFCQECLYIERWGVSVSPRTNERHGKTVKAASQLPAIKQGKNRHPQKRGYGCLAVTFKK